jgi:hypothetical protein
MSFEIILRMQSDDVAKNIKMSFMVYNNTIFEKSEQRFAYMHY